MHHEVIASTADVWQMQGRTKKLNDTLVGVADFE